MGVGQPGHIGGSGGLIEWTSFPSLSCLVCLSGHIEGEWEV